MPYIRSSKKDDDLDDASLRLEVMNAAIRLLSYRLRSEKELSVRLTEKGFEANLIRNTIRSLSEDGYLNDARFASELASSRLRNKHWGRLKIVAELRSKGISSDIIKSVLLDITEEDEGEAAIDAFKKWLSCRSLTMPLERAISLKAMRHLAAKGFSLPLARKTVSNYDSE